MDIMKTVQTAQAMILKGEYLKALELLEEVLTADDRTPQVFELLTHLYIQLGPTLLELGCESLIRFTGTKYP